MLLLLDTIRTDGGTQPRGAVDPKVIDTYQDAMEDGAIFPPVDVFYDGTHYWLADGFHRVRAKEATGAEEIECAVHQGTVEDAQWFSFGANKTNGLYRSNADKQRAVLAALGHSKSSGLSDREIARHLGIGHASVSGWRQKLSVQFGQIDSRTVTRDGSTYQQNVTNIGKTPAVEAPELPRGQQVPTEGQKKIMARLKEIRTEKKRRRSHVARRNDPEHIDLLRDRLIGILQIYARDSGNRVKTIEIVWDELGVPEVVLSVGGPIDPRNAQDE